jgi:hypothetical protein
VKKKAMAARMRPGAVRDTLHRLPGVRFHLKQIYETINQGNLNSGRASSIYHSARECVIKSSNMA